MSTFLEQIEKTENRYKENETAFTQAKEELARFHETGKVDWRKLDSAKRIWNRFDQLGLDQEMEEIVDPPENFNPLERIIRSNDLQSVQIIEGGALAARCVGKIHIRSSQMARGFGTGFMISPELMMTNNHVISNERLARTSFIEFNFIRGLHRDYPTSIFKLNPEAFFITNKDLDFTIVAVMPVNDQGDHVVRRGHIPLIRKSGKAIVGERVNIIQHPGGGKLQVAALHHSGVPRKENGNILLVNGQIWTGGDEDRHLIDWVSNEGIRISKITEFVDKNIQLSQEQHRMWLHCFEHPERFDFWETLDNAADAHFERSTETLENESTKSGVQHEEDGSISYLFRVNFGPVGGPFGSTSPSPSKTDDKIPTTPASQDPKLSSSPPPRSEAMLLAERLVEQFRHEGPYYDQEKDAQNANDYYKNIEWSAPSAKLFETLNGLTTKTHTGRFSYRRARLTFLYPAVDLHKDGKLRHIYSGDSFDVLQAIASELAPVLIKAEAQGLETTSLSLEALLDRDDLWENIEKEEELSLEERQETRSPFNCEHVVPQSWFEKKKPMKQDLHHLFTCDPDCNSFRSNIPYFEFGPEDEALRSDCGRKENLKFEPEQGKGAVARATMYFLVRYPGFVGNKRSEMPKSRTKILMDWHKTNPVTDYERHRNMVIHKVQGNRNPFIDKPNTASEALLKRGFA